MIKKINLLPIVLLMIFLIPTQSITKNKKVTSKKESHDQQVDPKLLTQLREVQKEIQVLFKKENEIRTEIEKQIAQAYPLVLDAINLQHTWQHESQIRYEAFEAQQEKFNSNPEYQRQKALYNQAMEPLNIYR